MIAPCPQGRLYIKWQFGDKTVYLRDRKSCFGSRMAPVIFYCLVQVLKHMLKRKEVNARVTYLDDFFI